MIDPTINESDAAFVRNPQPSDHPALSPPGHTDPVDEASTAFEKTRGMADSAISSLDRGRKPAARMLQNVAASIHEAAPHMPGVSV
jgi:hypothetical protein